MGSKDKAEAPQFIIFVGGYVFKDGKLLLAQRSYDEGHLPGHWAVPGGKVDIPSKITYDLLQQTVIKEIKEEVGIEVAPDMKLLSNNNFVRSDGHHVMAINFACTHVSGTPTPLEDTIDVKWVGVDELSGLKIQKDVLAQMQLAFSIVASA